MARLTSLRSPIPVLGAASAKGWADQRRGSSSDRGYGAAWQRARLRVLARDCGLCQPCKRLGHITPNCNEVDHIRNKAQGGTDDEANLQTICRPCHVAKTAAESRGAEWMEGAG